MSKSNWFKWALFALSSSVLLSFGACLGTTLQRVLVATAA